MLAAMARNLRRLTRTPVEALTSPPFQHDRGQRESGVIDIARADLYTAISGIGYLNVRSASTFQVGKMFVPIVTLGLLGVTLTALLRMVEKVVGPWTAAGRED
jgi:hypothetical protein